MKTNTSEPIADSSSVFTPSEEVTLARTADCLAAGIARNAGSGESVACAVTRALTERPEIVRAVHCHGSLLEALKKAEQLLSVAYAAIPFKKEIQAHLPYGFSEEIRDAHALDSLGISAAIAKAEGR